jgi:hypothetical protein
MHHTQNIAPKAIRVRVTDIKHLFNQQSKDLWQTHSLATFKEVISEVELQNYTINLNI